MKTALPLLALALASTAPVHAAAPSPAPAQRAPLPDGQNLALARQFVAISQADARQQMLDGFSAGVTASLDSVEDGPLRASFEKDVNEAIAASKPTIERHVPLMMEAFAQAYARTYSAAELRDLIAFASTPTGRRYFAEEARVEMDDEVMEAQFAMQSDLMPLFQAVAKKMCERKAAVQVASGDKDAKCPMA